MTSLSLVIPSHCRVDLLRKCLRSVIDHAPADTEVLVVDDGSIEGSVGRAAEEFAGVRVLRLERRRGFCAAVNRGIAAARGEIVELLNDDTEVTADWAAKALSAFTNARVAAVAPLVLQLDADGPVIDSAGDRYFLGGVAGKRGHGQRLSPAYLRPGRVFGASASSAFYRKEVLQRVGGFPEAFGAYFEDVDVSFRLNRAGYQVYFEPDSRVYHRVSASYGRPRRRLLEQQSLNEERVFWRNMPASNLGRALPLHAAVLAGKAWRRWQEGALVPFLCGRLRLLGELPELLRHRRRLRQLEPAASADCPIEGRFWTHAF